MAENPRITAPESVRVKAGELAMDLRKSVDPADPAGPADPVDPADPVALASSGKLSHLSYLSLPSNTKGARFHIGIWLLL
jgi:hypothetical protein